MAKTKEKVTVWRVVRGKLKMIDERLAKAPDKKDVASGNFLNKTKPGDFVHYERSGLYTVPEDNTEGVSNG